MTKQELKHYLFNYLYNIATMLSQGVNVIVFFGDPDESLSSRLGKSIASNGWASKVPWPKCVKAHFVRSIEKDRGNSGTFTREQRY